MRDLSVLVSLLLGPLFAFQACVLEDCTASWLPFGAWLVDDALPRAEPPMAMAIGVDCCALESGPRSANNGGGPKGTLRIGSESETVMLTVFSLPGRVPRGDGVGGPFVTGPGIVRGLGGSRAVSAKLLASLHAVSIHGAFGPRRNHHTALLTYASSFFFSTSERTGLAR